MVTRAAPAALSRIKVLVEIWKKYKHRLPSKLYQEHMLQIADLLFEVKLYQLALWQGYSLHLLEFSAVKITEITDVDHLMACFFPEGVDTDQHTFTMKIRAMHGCALCLFEQEKKHNILSQKGLCKLLRVLNFIRIIMKAFQRHEHLHWQIYNGALHIYTICRFLMTKKYSAQALEYLLWASISLELSIPLMTAKYLPFIVTLYCAVCHCYYDNQAEVQAEKFARRALGKINELAKLELQSQVPATRETQRAYKEASIKAPLPCTPTERLLLDLFDSRAGQFLGILEALWDSTTRPLQMRMPDDPEKQEVFSELLSAGISILSGENKVPIMSAVRFIKLSFQYKQRDVFTEFAREMQQVLSGVEGQSFRKAERELALLDSFNVLLSSQRSRPRQDNIKHDRPKSSFFKSDELTSLVDVLHKSVCGSALDVQPDGDLVLDIVLFVWSRMKVVRQKNQLQTSKFAHYRQKSSSTELLQKVCEVVRKGLGALARGAATLLPQDCSAVTDSAFMQKCSLLNAPAPFISPTSPEEENEEDEISVKEKEEMEAKTESDFEGSQQTQSTRTFLLARDLHLELDIIHHRASLKLLMLNAVTESELLNRIKKNKVSKALFLIQKALLVFSNMEPNSSSKTESLLKEASTLIEKAGMEERRVYMSTIPRTPAKSKDKVMKVEKNPPPPPILLSRTDHSFTFVPAPYNLEEQVCWYQLCGRVAEGWNLKVRLGDFSLPGTGHMVPAVYGECVLRVEGLEPNQKYVFAVAAYNSEGELLGSTIGGTTLPLLASLPVPLLSAWAHLAQLFLTSIFIETEINIHQGSLYCDSLSDNGPFIWEQEARLAECERMLVAVDLAMCLNDGSGAVQAVVSCYGLLAPLIFHQITCDPVVQTLRVLGKHQMADVFMDLGHKLLQEVCDAQQQIKIPSPLTGCKDPTILYDLIFSSTLTDAYQEVIKLRNMEYFTEFAALLLQRTTEEGHVDLVLNWGQTMFELLSREMQAVENLLAMMSSMVQRQKKQLQLRSMCCGERVWRTHLNYLMAQAHIAVFYQGLDQIHGGALQHRYSQFNPLVFSLAYSGTLVQRNSHKQQSSKHEVVLESNSSHSGVQDYVTNAHKDWNKKEAVQVEDCTTEESCEEGEGCSLTVEKQMETQRCTAAFLLESLNKAAVHLRRAMVLAHRGGHWTTLQYVCQTMWDQSCRITVLVQMDAQPETPSPITADQLHTIFTPLLMLAADLIMDMLNKLGLWSLYDSDLTEEELESSLHFTAPLDDSTQVDMRWIRTLVLHTLEQLHDSGKWENLAHFALLFNSYTRERYSLIVTPLLVHAQRRLLERIGTFGGPAVPQPHHVKTLKATGKEPSDLSEEDYSTPNAIYSLPISPDHMPTVTASYSISIEYLQANSHDSLRALALHEMGNLQFYNGNTRYILTSDISQRTKCCLLSAHLFKADLQYVSHSIGDELLSGVDLFSEPHRAPLGATVTSLNFVCHWLFTTGYYITMRVLTELCLFTEAMKEAVQLTQGIGVLLPYGHYISKASLQPVKTFYSNKSLLDNVEVLEELVNCDLAPEVQTLYGPTLCVRFNLARIQLVLALADSVHGRPMPGLYAVLLQTSPVIVRGSIPGSQKHVQELSHVRAGSEQDTKDNSVSDTLNGDCPRTVESSERIGVSLWLRCRFALVHSLTADVPGTAALFPGKNMNEEVARVLQEGLDECVLWGDHDIQARLMVEGAQLEASRGKTDDSMAMLQRLKLGQAGKSPRRFLETDYVMITVSLSASATTEQQVFVCR
nr:PREDICTED: uncharacterized protein LOC103355117 [Stegastes partitus]